MSGEEIISKSKEEAKKRKQNNGPLTVFRDLN